VDLTVNRFLGVDPGVRGGQSPRWGIAILILSWPACAITPPPPGGPLRSETFIQLQTSLAVAYGPAGVTARPPAGVDTRVTGNGQTFGPFALPIPTMLAVRQTLGRFAEFGADKGWLDSGIEARIGLPDASTAWPVVLSASWRSGRFGVINDPVRGTFQQRVSLEIYPHLLDRSWISLRLLASIGLSRGNFLHSVVLPDSFNTSTGDGPPTWDSINVVRPETRLQGTVGVDARVFNARLMVAVAPWVALSSGPPTYNNSTDARDFKQSWGMALMIAPGIGIDPIKSLRQSWGRSLPAEDR
jgi:hypothetical protein